MSSRLHGPAAWLLSSVAVVMMAFILAPLLVTLATSISNTEYIIFPPRGFTLQWYGKALWNEDFLSAMWFSTWLALAATTGAMTLGVPAAFALTRCEFLGRGVVASILLSPLVFPVLITGVALLQLFAMLRFDNTPVNMLIGHVLVTAPYVVRTTAASLSLVDTTLEDAARTLGAGNLRVFHRITVPQMIEWIEAARREPEEIDEFEAEF